MSHDIRVASFDIGKKNFAFYAEDCSSSLLLDFQEQYKKLPKKFQRRSKGPMNNEIDHMLQEIILDGKRVEGAMGVFDIRDDKTSNDLDIKTRVNMQNLLRSYSWLWDTTKIVIVEQQYFNISNGRKSKPSGANVDAIKLAECCACWFLDMYPNIEVLFFGSMYKTQILGAPDRLTKPQRKKWSIEKTLEIFERRGDTVAIEEMSAKKKAKVKLDDISDCVVMTQAFKFKTMVAMID